MPTVRSPVALLVMMVSWPAGATADGLDLADREASLLHRRLVLSGVKRWDRRHRMWTPWLIPPRSPTRLYVVNLWSVHCKPCLDEFPLLRRMAKAWLSDPRVAFLFVADPPLENSAAEFTDFWTRAAPSLPDVDPLRSETPALQKSIDVDARPVTLLVDEKLVVRQSFVGSVAPRNLGSAIERLLKALAPEP